MAMTAVWARMLLILPGVAKLGVTRPITAVMRTRMSTGPRLKSRSPRETALTPTPALASKALEGRSRCSPIECATALPALVSYREKPTSCLKAICFLTEQDQIRNQRGPNNGKRPRKNGGAATDAIAASVQRDRQPFDHR